MVSGVVWSGTDAGAPEWDIVVAERFVVAVPAGSGVIGALSRLATGGAADVEEVVAAIPVRRADAVDSFAVVWWSSIADGEVTAIVRGSAVVDLASPGGARRFDARGIRPFHLAEFREVDRLLITAASAPLAAIRAPGGAERAADRTTFRATSVGWAIAHDRMRPIGDADELAAADTVLSPRRRRDPAATPISPLLSQAAGAPSLDPASVTDPRVGPSLTTAPVATNADIPTQPIAQVPSGPPLRYRAAGDSPRTVDRVVLLGRRPVAPPERRADGAAPALVPVNSPRSLVSGTHLELRMVGARLVATDLRSTNGTTLRIAGSSRRLRAGESVVVLPGTVLELGGDTIIEILRPEEDAPVDPANGRPRT